MTEFKPGDRVRAQSLPTAGEFAGRTGEVVAADFLAPTGQVVGYLVRLDGGLPGGPGPLLMAFDPHELEPEAGGTP